MCGRFILTTPAEILAAMFRVPALRTLAPRFNIAPTQNVLVIRIAPATGERECVSMRWGLVPRWSREPGKGPSPINARAETLLAKRMFREPMRRRRCLILADGFYEWESSSGGKQPWLFRLADARPFAMAGLWETWAGPDGLAVESCTIITTSANALLARFHDRMPVILPPESHDVWLDAESHGPDEAARWLSPYPEAGMSAHRVSARVNRAGVEDPSLTEPLGEGTGARPSG
jgi:putative SOS response-associated peptidase YedK